MAAASDLDRPLSLMLVCGEPSGDQLGGQLMEGLREASDGRIHFTGVGGTSMTANGLESLFPLDDTAVMGLREVVPKIPAILRRVRQATDFALRTRPDAVVLIDSPDFTHRIARRLKQIDPSIATINYVAPQVWASRPYRARKMARYFDLVLALLPFERTFFEKHGLRAEFVGHPVTERASRMRGGAALRARLGCSDETPLVAVLPGSRTSEIRFILPVFREAIARLSKLIPGIVTILPTLPHVIASVRKVTTDWPTPIHIVEGDDDKYAALDAADVALAASGTVTTELALARTPMVVAYRVGALTYVLARPLFRLQYFTLVNLLLNRRAVPEYLQNQAKPDVLATELARLLQDERVSAAQVADLEIAAQALGEGSEPASRRAARAIIAFVLANRSSATHTHAAT